ncbi:unnamed protein product [Dibothriocephalus latus]|uniref:Uncharacterized protein n=1 Tax=Dibothriocephalus latus TaxID=60516 RepID=A0A3P6TXM7_DIBLA|nr:unnamed protein product [Dibothriocephalus latus]
MAALAPPPPGSQKSADPSTGRTLAVIKTDPDRSLTQTSSKDKADSPLGPGKPGHVRAGADRNAAETGNQDWETESYFGNEHTLILIICLSAIATMLAFIIFVMITWLRRRNRSQEIARSLNYGRQRNLDTMKRVFVDASKSPPYRNASGTLLHQIPMQAKTPTEMDRSATMVKNSRSSDCLAEANAIMLEPMAFHDNHILAGSAGSGGQRERTGGGSGPNTPVYAAGIGKIVPYSRAQTLVMAYSQAADVSRLQADSEAVCVLSSTSSENKQGTTTGRNADSPTTSGRLFVR